MSSLAAQGHEIERPPITATVGTIQGWPEIETAVRSVAESVRVADGDLIVADGSGLPAPPAGALGPNVTWHSHPGESTFQLRLRAYRLARGEVVAITEDHVHVPRDWATRHVRAHREHPDVQAIGGSVVNAATEHMLDWASFLVVQAACAAPIRSGEARRLSGAVNASYKRAALATVDDFNGLGLVDGLHQGRLAASGARLRTDDSIRVDHDQSLGFRGMTAINFHAGRTISGFKRRRMTAVDVLRFVGAPFVPLARYVRLVLLLTPRGYGSVIVRTTPGILWLLYAQSLGQTVGYVLGPGRSPHLVQ